MVYSEPFKELTGRPHPFVVGIVPYQASSSWVLIVPQVVSIELATFGGGQKGAWLGKPDRDWGNPKVHS